MGNEEPRFDWTDTDWFDDAEDIRREICRHCEPDDGPFDGPCLECNGRGKLPSNRYPMIYTSCEECNGTGAQKMNIVPCEHCGGRGYYQTLFGLPDDCRKCGGCGSEIEYVPLVVWRVEVDLPHGGVDSFTCYDHELAERIAHHDKRSMVIEKIGK